MMKNFLKIFLKVKILYFRKTSLVENSHRKIEKQYLLFEQEPANTTQTMATTSNRIETENPSSSRLTEQPETEVQESVKSKPESVPVEGLEETAAKLGVEPEFLVEKGTKALLRMIARNGGQLRFPLEIDQID